MEQELTTTNVDGIAEPEVVYHYTTMDAMMKITKSASIWATSISYLNDFSEQKHFLDLVRKRIPAYRETHTVEDGNIFEHVLDKSDIGFEIRPFVASFSREGDSLPQWRSYCPNGNGIAIEFRVDCLQRAFVAPNDDSDLPESLRSIPNVLYRAIDYLEDSSDQSLDREIDMAIQGAMSRARGHREHRTRLLLGPHTPADHFSIIIEQLACFKKHPSFSNEFEYRLLADGVFPNRAYVEFRSTRSTLVPYITIRIPREPLNGRGITASRFLLPFEDHWDFIDRVVIGPAPNKALSLEAVSAFFKKLKMNVAVLSSGIPYRDW